MKTYTTEIHLLERPSHPVYGRIFDGWLVGGANCFPTLTQRVAMTGKQATQWVAEVEEAAKKIRLDGSCIETKRVYENFS